MDANYADFVGRLFKTMGTPEASLMHAAVGISGEAGELLDTIKKTWVYNKPLDRANVIEELGDLFFYTTWLMEFLGISKEEVLTANINKLAVRYPNLKYSDEAAQARADKLP